MSLLSLISLQAGASTDMIFQLLPFLLILVVFYFFFIRPQAKKQKQQTAFIDELGKGDEIVTASGIIGRISKIDEKDVTLQLDQKTFIKIVKGAVSREMTEAYKKGEEVAQSA